VDPSLSDTKELLRKYGLRPSKRLGQNFLVDGQALARVVAAAEIAGDDEVLEIGPGLGGLTRLLAAEARRVVAVELDEALLPPLREVLGGLGNVEVIPGDILAVNQDELFGESGFLVVANIPYYITSAVIRHLLSARQRPSRLVLTVQKEVAERICAGAGAMSLLALSVQVYGTPKRMATIPARAFYPSPKVDSAVVRVDLYEKPAIPEQHLERFFRLSKAGFSQKRKTLRNALSAGMAWTKEHAQAVLQDAGIDPQRRAQTLSLEEWGRLVEKSGIDD
jgi:16S rRNA (adenine1518-N6/adenine1519-N6)-dimethyltransferase